MQAKSGGKMLPVLSPFFEHGRAAVSSTGVNFLRVFPFQQGTWTGFPWFAPFSICHTEDRMNKPSPPASRLEVSLDGKHAGKDRPGQLLRRQLSAILVLEAGVPRRRP